VIDYFHDGDGTYQVTTATGHVYLLQVVDGLVHVGLHRDLHTR
jgi:hypothetical protein